MTSLESSVATPARLSAGRVAGKVAIVTGIAGGIGKAIALRLAREGASVAGIDLDEKGLLRTLAEIRDGGGTALGVAGDATQEHPVAELIDTVVAEWGTIDILVNNIGGTLPGRVWELSVQDWDAIMALNLRSTFLFTRAVAPIMMRHKSGRIIGLSSGARNGTPWTARHIGGSAYAATKAAVCGFAKHVALELAPFGITVNAVAPGPIETEKLAAVFGRLAEMEDSPLKLTPLGRLGRPEEIASAVLFLASDEAAYISGVTLDVTGGR